MSDVTLAPFISGNIDAAQELRALGLDIAEHFLFRLDAAVRTPETEWDLFGWFRIDGMRLPVFKDEHRQCFVIFVIESEADGAYRSTLLHAGRIETYFRAGPPAGWHRLAASVVEPRLMEYYA